MCTCNQQRNTNQGCSGCTTTPCQSGTANCQCPVKDLSTDCIVYRGADLTCSSIEQDTVLTQLIRDLDTFICNKFNEAIRYLTLTNVGTGANVFKGISNTGERELRSIITDNNTLLDVIQNADTINIKAGTHRLELTSNQLALIVNTNQGDRTLTTVTLPSSAVDTFVQGSTFNSSNSVLTTTRNNSQPDITVDLSALNNHVESTAYNASTNNIELTLTDSSTVTLNVDNIFTDAQIRSNYLETNSSSPAFIENKNASRRETISSGGTYTVVASDNNRVIEIDNGTNNVTVDLSGSLGTSDFFVGFIQRGTGNVTFTGHDTIPSTLTAVLFGQGHTCALEIIGGNKYLVGNLRPA